MKLVRILMVVACLLLAGACSKECVEKVTNGILAACPEEKEKEGPSEKKSPPNDGKCPSGQRWDDCEKKCVPTT